MEKCVVDNIIKAVEGRPLEEKGAIRYINNDREVALDFLLNIKNGETIEDKTNNIFRECDYETARKFIDYILGTLRGLINDLNKATKARTAGYSLGDIANIEKAVSEIVIDSWNCMAKTEKERLQFVRVQREKFGSKDYYELQNKIHENDFEIGLKIVNRIFLLGVNRQVTMSMLYVRAHSLYGKRIADDIFDWAINALKEAVSRMGTAKTEYVKPGKEFKEYLSSEEFQGKRKALKR